MSIEDMEVENMETEKTEGTKKERQRLSVLDIIGLALFLIVLIPWPRIDFRLRSIVGYIAVVLLSRSDISLFFRQFKPGGKVKLLSGVSWYFYALLVFGAVAVICPR